MYVLSVDNIVDALIAKAVTLDEMIDPYDRAGQRDFNVLCSRMDTFEEIKQPVPAQIVAEAKKRLSVYVRPTTTNKR